MLFASRKFRTQTEEAGLGRKRTTAHAIGKDGGERVGAITEEMLRADVSAGAPTNVDGTFNLVHYAAWLLQEMGSGD